MIGATLRDLGGAVSLLFAVAVTPVRAASPTVEAAVPAYQKVTGVAGTLNSVGSDTLNNLMTLWAEEFRRTYPNVTIQVEGKGSATAPPALIQGTAQLGPMSRKMKPAEEDAFEKRYGCRPTEIAVALDCLAVYVNKDNPIESLTLPQLDGIFSKTYKRKSTNMETWGQLGLSGGWEKTPLSLYGRNSASGTYAYFKEHALQKGDYKDSVKEQPGSAAVVNAVASDRAAIGYSGIGYRTSEVRAVPVAIDASKPAAEPSFENAVKGSYPLGRKLYIYLVKKPGTRLDPLVEQYLRFVLSREGQEMVVKDGYGPLPATLVQKELQKLN